MTAAGVTPSRPTPRVYLVRRLVVFGGFVAAFLALFLAVFTGGGGYTVHARFLDAGQLVSGDLVEVGGVPVGKVGDITLTSGAQADVELNIDDGAFEPLPGGTTATIRAVGLSGVANRYVALTPGPASAPRIPDGGVIDMSQTHPIVDLDAVLDSLDPTVRRQLRGIIANVSGALAGVTHKGNDALRYLDPALSQTAAVTGEIAHDQLSFQRLIRGASAVAGTLATRRPELERTVGQTAATLSDIAHRRSALEDAIRRAPGVLRNASGTLARARRTLSLVPKLVPVVHILRAFGPTVERSRPLLGELRASLPAARRAFASFGAIARRTVPLARKTTASVRGGLPIFAATRAYSPDFINGFFNGLAGGVGGYYDANGAYVRITPLQGSGGLFGTSLLSPPKGLGPLAGYRTGLVARCPGGAVEPAPDGSNPWVGNPSLCDVEEDHR